MFCRCTFFLGVLFYIPFHWPFRAIIYRVLRDGPCERERERENCDQYIVVQVWNEYVIVADVNIALC